MVDQNIVLDIWKLTKHDVSKSDVEQILIEYEKRKNLQPATPHDTSLREDEVYMLVDTYDNDEEQYSSLSAVEEYIKIKSEDRDWDFEYIEERFRLYIRRKDSITIDVHKTISFTFS